MHPALEVGAFGASWLLGFHGRHLDGVEHLRHFLPATRMFANFHKRCHLLQIELRFHPFGAMTALTVAGN